MDRSQLRNLLFENLDRLFHLSLQQAAPNSAVEMRQVVKIVRVGVQV